MTARATRLWLAGATAIPLVRFFLDAARGLDYLHYQFLVDDAFYYFVLARHLPYFNEGIATSGFHPLYALVAAVFHTTLSPQAAILACLATLATANAACVWMLFRLLRRLFPLPVALISVWGWAASTRIHALTLTGVETILAVLAVLFFLERFVRLLEEDRWDDPRGLAGLGIAFAVAFWARMDAPVLLLPAGVYVLGGALKRGGPKALLAFGLPAASLIAIWLGFIALATGSPYPTSAEALRVLRDARPEAAVAWTGLAQTPLRYLQHYLASGPAPLPVTLGLVAAIGVVFGLRRVGRPGGGLLGLFASIVMLGFAVWVAWYSLVLGGFRLWYGLYLAIFVYALLAPVTASLVVDLIPARRLGIALAASIVIAVSVLSRGGPIAAQEYDKYRAAQAANAYLNELPEGVRVGSFNAGIYNFYTDADVLNLDGVVNPNAIEAHRTGNIAAYMQRMNVRVLIEHDPSRAATFRRVARQRDVRFERWVDLSEAYEPYARRPHKRTFLWKVSYPDEGRPGASPLR